MSELAVIDTAEPWHRMKNETAQAFHAFNIWRNLPPPRTIREAARINAESGRSKVDTQYTRFKAWATKHRWQERGDAFDQMLDRRHQEARESMRQQIDREQMLEGRYLRTSAITRFTGGMDAAGQPIAPIDWSDLDPQQALAIYKTGRDTERQASGLAIGASLGLVPLSHIRQITQELFDTALEFIDEERRQAFVLRVRRLGENGPN